MNLFALGFLAMLAPSTDGAGHLKTVGGAKGPGAGEELAGPRGAHFRSAPTTGRVGCWARFPDESPRNNHLPASFIPRVVETGSEDKEHRTAFIVPPRSLDRLLAGGRII
jgi:hypothetical protein